MPTIDLHLKQSLVYMSEATEILYGGAAGGGKSFLMRAIGIDMCWNVPGIQVYLFRKNYNDLVSTHLYNAGGLLEMLNPYTQAGHIRWTGGEKKFFRFWNGATLYLRHIDNESDVLKYQGAEIHVLLMDELTHFSEYEYRYLRSRVRLGGFAPPENYAKKLPRIISGANPGGPGHQWVKRTFIDSQQPMDIVQQPDEEGGMLRQFIPAKLSDNPTMEANDPTYRAKLAGLGSPDLVKAMLDGDWDITAGAAFEMLSRKTHLVRNFKIPQHWTRFTSMDWGSSKPFAVGWFAVVEGDTKISAKDGHDDVYLPDGAVVMYREYYGWNGKPDEGCRMQSADVAREILRIEKEAGDDRIDYRIGDSAMWARTDGPSVFENMFTATDGQINLRQAEKDRMHNYQEVRSRLIGQDGRPMFYIMSNCQHAWRTLPGLQLDQRQPEKGPDTTQEDHMYDAVSYGLRSRPYVTTARERKQAAWDDARRQIGLKDVDPYQTKKKRPHQ